MNTIEIRWFFPQPPRSLQQLEGATETRTDWYAPIATHSSSVKWRAGRLEAKFLAGEPETEPQGSPQPFDSGWQSWRKISLALPDGQADLTLRLAQATWLPVQKERTLHAFRLDHLGNVQPTGRFDDTIQVEWCRVELPASTAWTFCIEGSASMGRRPAERVLSHLSTQLDFDLADFPEPQAYPAWLLHQAIQ